MRIKTIIASILNFQIERVWRRSAGLKSVALRQGSPYRIFMNNIIKKMTENGEINRIFREWQISKPDCSPVLRSGKSVKLTKLAPLFMLVGLGVCLGVIVMFLEIIIYHLKPKKLVPVPAKANELLRFKLILAEAQKALHSNNKPCNYLLEMVEDSAKKLKTN